MDNKIRLSFPKTENGKELQAIRNAVYILEEAKFRVQTTNTVGEPCEPNKEYTPENYEPFFPNEEQQRAINEADVIIEKTSMEIIGTRPQDR